MYLSAKTLEDHHKKGEGAGGNVWALGPNAKIIVKKEFGKRKEGNLRW